MTPDTVTRQELIDFVILEARLLDDKQYEEWNALFTDDAYYWVPLTPDQPEDPSYTSHLYEDKLLRTLRIERLKSPRVHAQHPPSRGHHLLQTPTVEEMDTAGNHFLVRTSFQYSESQGDRFESLVGVAWHKVTVQERALRFAQKRVDVLNCDAALPAVQLFI